MKFGEKFELLESLTSGVVETFITNDKVRGKRVLVHILDCDAQKPNQSTVQWVLDAFRKVAPEPVGLVLETGRYSGTLYGYLVTEIPEETELRRWVQSYNDHVRDTQETMAPPEPPEQSAVQVAEPTSKEPPPTSAQPPSNLGAAGERSGLHPAPSAWDLGNPVISAPPKREDVRSSVDAFRSDFKAKEPPSETITPVSNSPKPGEFTRFFQGPFRADGPSEVPAITSRPIEPPRKKVGDFTAMFGPLAPPQGTGPLAEPPGTEAPSAGFTGWFNNLESNALGSDNSAIPSRISSRTPVSGDRPSMASDAAPPVTIPPKQASPLPLPPAPLPPLYVEPAPPIFPPPLIPAPATQKPPAASSPVSLPGGATRAFTPAGSEPVPSQTTAPNGPSPYTQIISVKSIDPPAVPAEEEKTPAKLPTFPAPPKPSFPAMTPPPPLKMPPAPPMAAPIPKFAPPPAPKAAADAPAPPVSWWPLILTLTVLFFIAVLLVLYFVLKH